MAKLKTELKAILDRYGIDYQDKDKLWDCHGTLVLYHKAYEIIAAQESILFDPPTIIEGSSENKIVAMLVVGRMGDRYEWSVGEAAPGNNKNPYPYAMAEKRAKDRVIAKLVGLSAYVYSEEEADDFKSGARVPVTNGGGSPAGIWAAVKETVPSLPVTPPPAKPASSVSEALAQIKALPYTAEAVGKWQALNNEKLDALQEKQPAAYDKIMDAINTRLDDIDQLNAASAA